MIVAVSISMVSGIAVFIAAISMMMMISAKVRSAEPPLPVAIGTRAPDFELENIQGERVRLADFKGRPTLIVFWADWCPDCKQIVPELNRIHADNVAVLGINLMESRERAADAVQDEGIRYPVLLDEDGEVGRTYGVQAIPNIFVLDSEGRLVEHRYTLPSKDLLYSLLTEPGMSD
jgi:peroxiredoxin